MVGTVDDDSTMMTQEEEEEEIAAEKIINEEYKTWKKNAPFLYDMVISNALDWPTLTTEWFPDKQKHPDHNYSTHRLLIGTHTSGEAQNYLQIAHAYLPNPLRADIRDYDELQEELGGRGGLGVGGKDADKIKFSIVQKIDHPGEVNKARYMPQNPELIASMCPDGRILVFDRTKHSLVPNGVPKPDMELVGHEKEGYGMSWSPHQEGHLVTGSEDATVRIWDITHYSQDSKVLSPQRTFQHHTTIVNDVQYHPHHPALIGTVSDDGTFQVLDTRRDSSDEAALKYDAHEDVVNALAFSPSSEYVFATASGDKSIGLWDLRNIKIKLHSLEGHQDAVTSLSWNPHEESVLGSAGYDRRVVFWDLSQIGVEQQPDDIDDGPPEL
ncbi:MAG: Histone acetyltransferase type B subunit 2 [Watsoniomyces obsoletus]|nr:MAG: Histone acetyltransferase type B subunit 2 [Watsoniomyces obsoletus]